MKKYFITGLVTLLPLAVTIWVVHFFVDFLTKPFVGVVSILTDQIPLGSPKILKTFTQFLILISLFLIIFGVGFVARKYFFKNLLKISGKILAKIPIVNKVYKTTKDMVDALFSTTENSFKQVVLLQFPYPGAWCLGLIARAAPKSCSEAEGEELLTIYIPTTPNPSTGYLVMSQKKDLIYLDMKAQDAIKYVVSCAVIQPDPPETLAEEEK